MSGFKKEVNVSKKLDFSLDFYLEAVAGTSSKRSPREAIRMARLTRSPKP
ncbi:hypothetical protein BN1224_CV14_A_00060 [Chlamydia pneumoniae]|uniref:Uncharacterized protein n=1 Tax=Chlamydia pneumoniae TaxID=83558 RepID=A0A0F7XS94_CHLPN|nr:hypothetical protein BN1224_Wien1_A_00060 [Chlamydia pneumoniae]CRI35359.1 hypothetical protein BN1224_CM1_A_00060 [Chlamydia pneumoniae]CRI36487.1 hypothetical protein BN1224_CV14_A_00060 [Chlamydia pneumoniae]CRI37610.1 hypothetical protein BN1224_CV15_A_00060 [Chlamydia pneumoniae]CRI38742.1 hypothetical protein BN1224_CWL011_A_00060 [Chlamydia pneumoniae]